LIVPWGTPFRFISTLENFTKLLRKSKPRVPDTFQLGAISAFFDFRARQFFNNLSVFSKPEYSNSPRLHQNKPSVINRLRLFLVRLAPDTFQLCSSTGGGGTE
jgi:hypothetical protein